MCTNLPMSVLCRNDICRHFSNGIPGDSDSILSWQYHNMLRNLINLTMWTAGFYKELKTRQCTELSLGTSEVLLLLENCIVTSVFFFHAGEAVGNLSKPFLPWEINTWKKYYRNHQGNLKKWKEIIGDGAHGIFKVTERKKKISSNHTNILRSTCVCVCIYIIYTLPQQLGGGGVAALHSTTSRRISEAPKLPSVTFPKVILLPFVVYFVFACTYSSKWNELQITIKYEYI